jgi:hypothetical protein
MDNGAFDGGADDGGKLAENGTLVFGAERNGVLDGPKQLFPVAQQEEEQIQHDEKSDDDLECSLADIDGLSSKELAPSHENVGQSLLHRGKVGQPEAIEQIGHPWRQGVQDLLKIVSEIQFAGAEPLVQA